MMRASLGLRHFAIATALSDDIWSRYKVAEFVQAMDPSTKSPYIRNYLNHPHDGDMMFPSASLDKLVARAAPGSDTRAVGCLRREPCAGERLYLLQRVTALRPA